MEVICSGLNIVDVIIKVPKEITPGEKNETGPIKMMGGGPAGNAACDLAVLGHQTGFLGYFGDNYLSDIAKSEFTRYGVKDDLFISHPKAEPAMAIVQVDSLGERTVLFSRSSYVPMQPSDIDLSIFNNCKLILVDGYDIEVNTYLLKFAQEKRIPTVLDIEDADINTMQEMISLANHSILPLLAAQKLTQKTNVKDCLKKISHFTDGQIVITDGINGSFTIIEDTIFHQPAFKVQVVDTTGCGDAYHAAYASGIIKGMDVKNCMKYASFFASLVAQEYGGRIDQKVKDVLDENFPL